MLKHASHASGVKRPDEILFETSFGYMFPHAAHREDCLLPVQNNTITYLLELGAAMADPGDGNNINLDSEIPSLFTYLGQFIDHDITARTDRETEGVNEIFDDAGNSRKFTPTSPKIIVQTLKNGRRPHLDLDSVYGDGPALVPGSKTLAQFLYRDNLKMEVVRENNPLTFVDLPRDKTNGRAIIGDARNDENVIIGQLHAAFLAAHNRLMDRIGSEEGEEMSDARRYIEARQLLRWGYQMAVVNDYLPGVCDPNVVEDVLRNGPKFYEPGYSGASVFMPLEFSVAGFRFGHTMVRPSYRLRNGGNNFNLEHLLGVSNLHRPAGLGAVLLDIGNNYKLKNDFVIEWNNFASFAGRSFTNKARLLDPRLSAGLFQLQALGEGPGGNFQAHLAQRNLVRGYLLSIPTGQACAKAMGIKPLSADELKYQPSNGQPLSSNSFEFKINDVLEKSGFDERTPLWFYILREAEVQQQGQRLGAVGSHIVAETLIGLVKQDPNSYLNHVSDTRIHLGTETEMARKERREVEYVVFPGGNNEDRKISSMADIIKYADMPINFDQ